jgi:hypothetical protein
MGPTTNLGPRSFLEVHYTARREPLVRKYLSTAPPSDDGKTFPHAPHRTGSRSPVSKRTRSRQVMVRSARPAAASRTSCSATFSRVGLPARRLSPGRLHLGEVVARRAVPAHLRRAGGPDRAQPRILSANRRHLERATGSGRTAPIAVSVPGEGQGPHALSGPPVHLDRRRTGRPTRPTAICAAGCARRRPSILSLLDPPCGRL